MRLVPLSQWLSLSISFHLDQITKRLFQNNLIASDRGWVYLWLSLYRHLEMHSLVAGALPSILILNNSQSNQRPARRQGPGSLYFIIVVESKWDDYSCINASRFTNLPTSKMICSSLKSSEMLRLTLLFPSQLRLHWLPHPVAEVSQLHSYCHW